MYTQIINLLNTFSIHVSSNLDHMNENISVYPVLVRDIVQLSAPYLTMCDFLLIYFLFLSLSLRFKSPQCSLADKHSFYQVDTYVH